MILQVLSRTCSIMTMSYQLCVFLDSRREQGILASDVIYRCLVLHYMSKATLPNDPRPDKIVGNQRIQEMI
jgi:hypothetical protein